MLRKPPRAPPYTDFDDFVEDMCSQFNVIDPATGQSMKPPERAAEQWTESEIQMWFASGGQIAPSEDPKMRAAANKMSKSVDIKSPAQLQAEQMIKDARAAAMKAPYFSKLSERDFEKASLYRDTVLTLGHPEREVAASDLFGLDDPWLRELHKTKHIMPFTKHLLYWDNSTPNGVKKVLYGEEGFTHGPSAALRGMDMRYFWDASNFKVVGAVRYSLAAVIAWRQDEKESWSAQTVHGGCIEMVLDDLTAEVMKINLAPEVRPAMSVVHGSCARARRRDAGSPRAPLLPRAQMVTAEITFKLKMPSLTDTTYKVEAEILECEPPRCNVVGRIKTLDDKLVAEVRRRELTSPARCMLAAPLSLPCSFGTGTYGARAGHCQAGDDGSYGRFL